MNDELIDNIARELYHMRSMAAAEMTDEKWERKKKMFPGSVRILREEAKRMVENGEFDD